jgi:hypothetical protein
MELFYYNANQITPFILTFHYNLILTSQKNSNSRNNIHVSLPECKIDFNRPKKIANRAFEIVAKLKYLRPLVAYQIPIDEGIKNGLNAGKLFSYFHHRQKSMSHLVP